MSSILRMALLPINALASDMACQGRHLAPSRKAVANAIAALPERQREAILLVHYQDMSGAEAASALDVSVEALESLLARGRRALRAQLADPKEATDV